MLYAAKHGLSKKTRDILVLVILILVLCMLLVGILYVNAARRDKRVSNALLEESLNEINDALNSILRLSRVGGSFTTMQMGEVREHLYAASRMVGVVQRMYGVGGLLETQGSIEEALRYVAECEDRLVKGQSIDNQLLQLRGIIEVIGRAR